MVRNDAGDCHDFNSGDLKVVKAKVDLPSAPVTRNNDVPKPQMGWGTLRGCLGMLFLLFFLGTKEVMGIMGNEKMSRRIFLVICGLCIVFLYLFYLF